MLHGGQCTGVHPLVHVAPGPAASGELTWLDAGARLPGHVALQAPAVAQPLQAVQALHCGMEGSAGASLPR